MNPYVTIAIPFYNAEKTLLDAVRSVFAQTYENWELILLDDGSSDRSLEIARSINDPRVRVISDGQNKKLPARLNQIVGLAKYDYIARMDADDLMVRSRIERQMNLLKDSDDFDIVTTGLCSLSNDYEPVGLRLVEADHEISGLKLLQSKSGIVHASVVGRKSWFMRNSYREDAVLGQDTNLWVRAYSSNDLNVAFIPEPLYFYMEDSSVTRDKMVKAYRQGRLTIFQDAKFRFSMGERVLAALQLYAKEALVEVLSITGRISLLRSRRCTSALSGKELETYYEQIAEIRNWPLPQSN